MGSLLLLTSLHPTILHWAVGRQIKTRFLFCWAGIWGLKCTRHRVFLNFKLLLLRLIKIFLQNWWSKMWFTVVCVIFMRESSGIFKAERGYPGSSVGFVHEGNDALEGKGNGGFCKIIWPNFMYLTSGKLCSETVILMICTAHPVVLKKKKLISFEIRISNKGVHYRHSLNVNYV